ncbi:hypothetical protein ACLOJK_017449 [Asimina triloba]
MEFSGNTITRGHLRVMAAGARAGPSHSLCLMIFAPRLEQIMVAELAGSTATASSTTAGSQPAIAPLNTYPWTHITHTKDACRISLHRAARQMNPPVQGLSFDFLRWTTEDIYSASKGDFWKKNLPLSNGRMNPNVGRRAFIKVPRSNSTLPSPPGIIPTGTGRGKKDQSTLVVILSSLLASSAFLNFFLLSLVILMIFFSSRKKSDQVQPHPSMIGVNLRRFTYHELEKATDQFKEELCRGSCGVVYKGMITSENVNLVAVKRLEKVANEAAKEFKTEVSAIGQIHYKNLVRLIGFCEEGEERLLVYEYMSNGSLASFLFGDSRPSWHQRTGLVYLHEECGRQIIQCDIKPENILLDDSFTARISDFGLAKLLVGNQIRTTTNIRGTRGYVAPEWFKRVAITTKVDVYSFGVMLLEIICGKRHVLPELEQGDDTIILTDWVCDCYREGRIDGLVENDEAALKDVGKVERMVTAAIWCIQ